MLKYYNDETKTLTIPFDYNKEINDIPDNTKNIIFDECLKTIIFILKKFLLIFFIIQKEKIKK